MLSWIMWLLAPKEVKNLYRGFKESIEELPTIENVNVDELLRERLIPGERFVTSVGRYRILYAVKRSLDSGVVIRGVIVFYNGKRIKYFIRINPS